MSFLMPSLKSVSGCVWAHLCTASWPLHHLQITVHVTNIWIVQKYGNQMGWDLDCVLHEKQHKFQFSGHFHGCCCHTWSSISLMQNDFYWQNSSAFSVNSGSQLPFKNSTVLYAIDHVSMIQRMVPLMSQNNVNVTLLAECTLRNFFVLGDGMWFHSML